MKPCRKFHAGWLFLALSASACGAAPKEVEGQDAMLRPASGGGASTVTNDQRPINERFRNLDEYLAYLQKMDAPLDKPWYREVRPGIYQLQTGNFRPLGGTEPNREFTREELERKFGFSR